MKRVFIVFCLSLLVFASLGCIDQEAQEKKMQERMDVIENSDPERFTITYEIRDLGSNGDCLRVIHDNELNVTIYQTVGGHGYEYISAVPDREL